MRVNNIARRHDIDWLRVITIALLIIYHVSIGFQPWGLMIGFITNKESWTTLWTPMSMLNVWRIPLLFFVAGMGVFFALQKRSWVALIKERSSRILLPFVVGMLVIVPIHCLVLQNYYSWPIKYNPHPSHLWFLGNIFSYTIIFLPLFVFINNNLSGRMVCIIKRGFGSPLGLLIVMLCFAIEAMLVKPFLFELYAMTAHGYILGLLAFLFGYIFMLCGKPLWSMLLTLRWAFFVGALLLYVHRIDYGQTPLYQISIEANLWVFCVFGFGHKYLNRPSPILSYLSQSAYPIYIIHMIVMYGFSYLFFPLGIGVKLKYLLLAMSTLTGSVLLYELLIRRVVLLRPLFGLKSIKRGVIASKE